MNGSARRLRRALLPLLFAVSLGSVGCANTVRPAEDPVIAARRAGADSRDGEVVGRWLMSELITPGGSREQAGLARLRLDSVAKDQRGVYASIARGLDDEAHGALRRAAAAYLAALESARDSDSDQAELLAWFASSRLLLLRGNVADLWSTAKAPVESLIAEPGRIGWRARGDLVRFWMFDTRDSSAGQRREREKEAERLLGCFSRGRFAGPFGRAAPLDIVTTFPAEAPGAWQQVFAKDPARLDAPEVQLGETGSSVCTLRAVRPSGEGVHYVEAFFSLDSSAEVLLSVKPALSVRVDDVEVQKRDPRAFGTWATSAVHLRLAAGNHRVVARLAEPEAMITLLDRAGRPIPFKQPETSAVTVGLTPPKVLADPHVLSPWVRAAVSPRLSPPGAPAPADPAATDDPVLRFLASQVAHADGLDDLATVLIEPLVKEPSRATPIALSEAALYIEGDPVFAANDARDLALDYRKRAVEKDARMWYPQVWIALDSAQKQGEKEQLAPLAQLALDFPEVPAVGRALAGLYGKLGYRAEQKRTIVDLSRRFPSDVELLRSLVAVMDEEGNRAEADKVAAKIATIDPSSTIEIERLVQRGDLAGAAKRVEARASGAVGQEKREALRRIGDLLLRAGQRKETLAALEQALAEEPGSARLTLELADGRLATGDHAALRRALADSLARGRETAELRDAIEVVDGVSELEPFRMNGKAVVAEYEKSGAAKAGLSNKKGGTAARVLDYATVWVHKDGSARMLEHEILHMQSIEAIAEHAEQKLPRGKLLHIRTIKPNGEVFEPEIVAKKPTATMPHLELGDYIETETLYDLPAQNAGQTFVSPRWFFREEKVDYHRSEFVIVAPKERSLDVETTGDVPPAEVTQAGAFTVRRWRVDKSPALPNERFGAPISEFLPSVRAGWGVSQEIMLTALLDRSTRLTPEDPRLVRIAKTIATQGARPDEQEVELAKVKKVERARRIYRWVLDNVEPARESDPRKSVVGKAGSRLEAFIYLARLAGIDARHAVVRDRLRPPALGPIAEAEQFSELAVALRDDDGTDVWTQVDDKYAPFGYLPSSMRGQPAVILRPGLPRLTTGTGGPPDGVKHEGTVKLASDGSGKLSIKQSYSGRFGIVLREQIQKIADDERLKNAIESKLLPDGLPGARVLSLGVKNLEDLDAPLVLELELEVSALARKSGTSLVMAPPFASSVRLANLTTLEKRETPLLLPPALALRLEVKLSVELPKGAKLDGSLDGSKGQNDGRSFQVSDRLEGDKLLLDRVIDVPAGRVQPADYAAFVEFARAADAAVHRDLSIRLP